MLWLLLILLLLVLLVLLCVFTIRCNYHRIKILRYKRTISLHPQRMLLRPTDFCICFVMTMAIDRTIMYNSISVI